jgi:predicted nucleic acid-binding protein
VELQPDHPDAHRAVMRCGLFGPDTQKFSEAEKAQIQKSIAQLAGQEGSGLKPMELTKDLSNLTDLMRQASETAGRAEELFSTKGLPMAFLSHMLGRSPFKIWSGLTVHHRLFVPMALGSQEEQDSEATKARAAKEIVIDISALFTLKTLNMLDLLPKMFTKVYVATTVFESIKLELDELTAFKAPQGVLGYKDGRLVMADVSPETFETRKIFLADLLVFLKSEAVRLSGIEGTIWEDTAAGKTIEALGEAVGHSIAVAKGRNLPLYSDDVGVRALAKNEHELSGFCTQAFLRAAVAKRQLEPTSYEDAVLSLFRHNYNFVSESAETVLRALHADEYDLTPLTRRLVSRISQTDINRPSSAAILGQVIGDIWIHAGRSLREQWIDLTAKNLAAIEQFADVCAVLLRTLALSLLRLPAEFVGLCRAVETSGHLSPQQRDIWRFLCELTAQAAEKACPTVAPGEPHLKSEWRDNIRVSKMLNRAIVEEMRAKK